MQSSKQTEAADFNFFIPTAPFSVLEKHATLLGINTKPPDPEGACTPYDRLRYFFNF
jgi:hypothetical protein